MKFDARVDFTNGGHVEAKDFLLDIEGDSVAPERLAEMIVSAMNLLRAGPVTITAMRSCAAASIRIPLPRLQR